jgi:diguanylate cyclase (GGDEF)-like protein/PAS domain S-box-containing protein
MTARRFEPAARLLARNPLGPMLLAVTAVLALCLVSGAGGPAFASDLTNVATVLMATAASAACLWRAARRPGSLRRTWIGVGLGALSYAFGEGCWTWIETVRGHEVGFPALPDVGYLGMVPLFAAGLLLVPVASQSVANRVRTLIDGLMIAASLLLISWILVIHPLIEVGGDSRAELWVVLGYPVGDIVLITVVLHVLALLRRGRRETGPLLMIGAAVLVIGVSDSVYAYMTLQHSYSSGGLLDLGWFAGFALVLLAARPPVRDTAQPITPPLGEDAEDDRQPFGVLVPYAVVLVALVVSVVAYSLHGRTEAFFYWCRTVLILLIVVRQLLTLLENRQLTDYLESRVTRRTTALQASEQRFRALVQQSSESIAVADADSTVRYQSESIERIFGFPAGRLIGHRITTFTGKRTGAQIAAAIDSIRGQPYGSVTIEVLLPHIDGRRRQSEMIITNLLDDPSVRGLVINTRDVSDATELQDLLVHEAYHDALTGLASRALFRERLDEALTSCARHEDVSVLLLDLDGFKEVNDSLGHGAGDQLLVQVADRLRESVRAGDMVARFGGDEFAVLIESIVARADAETVAARTVAAMAAPFDIGGRDLHVGVSVGIASAGDATDVQQLLRNADLAMYKAKGGGGNSFAAYDPQMHDDLMQRLQLEADLRVALDQRQLALHYQPTVDLASGAITGFEALVRWHHPTRGMVSPLDFIGIAEATGLIVPLGRWVLEEACRQAVAWGAGTTRALKMAVNVSVRQFDHGDLAAMVTEVLAATGMRADQLCLEMTESVMLTDTAENLTQLLRLRSLGVTLAMDDFGTGYSSLAYLRRFPMDILKIDRSFVDRLGGDTEDSALVHTIIRLGQSLGMATVAEGIENGVQLQALQEMGCDFAQGYFLSRPVAAPEATRLLAEGLSMTPFATTKHLAS